MLHDPPIAGTPQDELTGGGGDGQHPEEQAFRQEGLPLLGACTPTPHLCFLVAGALLASLFLAPGLILRSGELKDPEL